MQKHLSDVLLLSIPLMQLLHPLVTKHFVHAALAPLIEQHGVPDRLLAKGFTNMFNSLAHCILSQQLAVKAARIIQGRFMALCKVSIALHTPTTGHHLIRPF